MPTLLHIEVPFIVVYPIFSLDNQGCKN